MGIVESIILGVVQGITEFLPISSSGHLIIIRELLGLPLEGSLSYDVLLHLATLLVIIIYFWGDLRHLVHDALTEGFSSRSRKLIWAIIVGTVPAILVGYFGSGVIEEIFRNVEYVAYALIIGSLLFFLADQISAHKFKPHYKPLSILKGFGVGVFQAFALIPGTSRSGSTISGGLLFGLSREEAIRFAFLLGIPAILGAGLKVFLNLVSDPHFHTSYFINLNSILGFLAAFFSGLWAIRFLVRYLTTHTFTPFIIYRLVLAAVILGFL